MQIALRCAHIQDFDFCKRLYFDGMKTVIEELHLDPAAQEAGLREQWIPAEVHIITLNGSDVGWLQTKKQEEGVLLAQLFVDAPFQRSGIGTEIMDRLIAKARKDDQAVLLAVAKMNPALRLYKRLSFHVTHEDERKFYMRRDPRPV